MADKYNTVTESVTAVQFTFDTVKDIYIFLDYRDATYSIKNRTLTGIITDQNGSKIALNKTDWVVKNTKGEINVYSDSVFKTRFVAAS